MSQTQPAPGRGAARRPTTTGGGQHRRGLALLVIAGAQLMVVLDTTIVKVALPHIQRAIGFSRNGLEWVITAYALSFGGLLPGGHHPHPVRRPRRHPASGHPWPPSLARFPRLEQAPGDRNEPARRCSGKAAGIPQRRHSDRTHVARMDPVLGCRRLRTAPPANSHSPVPGSAREQGSIHSAPRGRRLHRIRGPHPLGVARCHPGIRGRRHRTLSSFSRRRNIPHRHPAGHYPLRGDRTALIGGPARRPVRAGAVRPPRKPREVLMHPVFRRPVAAADPAATPIENADLTRKEGEE